MKTDKPPAPEEPSLLDYLKSRLKFWESGGKIEIPPAPGRGAEPAAPSAARAKAPPPKPEARPAWRPKDWPWRSLLALVFVLVGQVTFEPSPARTALPGLVFYAIGLAWLFLACLRGEWTLAPPPETGSGSDPLRVRLVPLAAAIVLALLAFLTLGGNLFTPGNVSLWALAVLCFVWAFWLPGPRARPDQAAAAESGPEVSGNALDNDRLRGPGVAVVSARQGRRQVRPGVPFATAQGGTLTLEADGTYRYLPPVWDNVPPGGLQETFRYTIRDKKGASSSSTLTVAVSDSDRLPAPPRPVWKRLQDFLGRSSWQFTVTRWGLLVLAVTALVVFYRVYRIDTVPVEPFSDHAEKVLDVYELAQGQTQIFFERNTGREAIQMYLTFAVAWLFGTGFSFLSLKIGTVLCGLATLPFIYLLGKEIGGRRVALLALLFAGIAYWPNVIARVGLRFPLYPLFVAPTLYFLIRGLRRRNRNDFILSGLFLGVGLHGYSPIRILPLLLVIAVGLYLLHAQSKGARKQALVWLALLSLASLVVFLPLARYWLDNSAAFGYRAFSRLGSIETPLPAPAWQVFLSNTWNALRMFNWDDGEIWVHSVTHRPALDVVSGALFVCGALLVLVRYVRQRHWLDLFLLVSVPVLLLPSILSLAYPGENPALNRAGGAMVPTFLLVALALDGLLSGVGKRLDGAAGPGSGRRPGAALAGALALVLVAVSANQNFNLVFDKYAGQFRQGAWNSSQMGQVIQQFGETYGTTDSVWIVPYPHWVDTRLPGVWAGIPDRDFALWPEELERSLPVPGPKLFLLKPDDETGAAVLESLYPQGVMSRFASGVEGHDFLIYFVPPEK